MKLYLVQHAEAVSEQQDPTRPLSEKGQADLAKVRSFIEPLGITVDYLWHSGKTRAVQTAEQLAKVMKINKALEAQTGLGPNDDVSSFEQRLVSVGGDIMIVGHMPFLGRLASLLLSASEAADTVRFQPGGIVCLEYDRESGWQIRWMIIPQILKS